MRFDPNIEIRGLCARQWHRLLALGARLPHRPGERLPRPWLLRVRDGERILKIWHSEQGRRPLEEGRGSLEELAARHGEARIISVDSGALSTAAGRWQAGLGTNADTIASLLTLHAIFMKSPGIELHPAAHGLPLSAGFIGTALGLLLPKDRAAILLVTTGGSVDTSLILRRGPLGVDLLASAEIFSEAELPRPGLFTPAFIEPLARAVAQRFAVPALAIGIELRALLDWRRCPTGEHLSRLEAAGHLCRPIWPWRFRALVWALEQSFQRRRAGWTPEHTAARTAPLSAAEFDAWR